MAFQAGGAHALDRALEAIAYAYEEMSRYPATALWEKPAKGDPIRLKKNFTVTGRGVALVIGCNTFPTWNSWPGLFASLVTGNAVVVKPHPLAVLPLAITVEVCREVLAEAGLDPNLVTLVAEHPDDGLAKPLALRPEVKIIDFTGGSEFGEWLEQNATQAERVHREGRRQRGHHRLDRLLQGAVQQPRLHAVAVLRPDVHHHAEPVRPGRRHRDRRGAQVLRRGRRRHRHLDQQAARRRRPRGRDCSAASSTRPWSAGSSWPRSTATSCWSRARSSTRRTTTPWSGRRCWSRSTPRTKTSTARECFGPVSFLVRTSGTPESIELFRPHGRRGRRDDGRHLLDRRAACWKLVRDAALDVGVALSENLTGQVFVNQSAAFSDFHGTGANPAANATYTDGAYVASRFRVIQSRRHA